MKDDQLRKNLRNLKHVDPFYIRQIKQGLKYTISNLLFREQEKLKCVPDKEREILYITSLKVIELLTYINLKITFKKFLHMSLFVQKLT
jgi:hypothetical protein